MKSVFESIVDRFNGFFEATAQAIRDSDWNTVLRNAGFTLAFVLCVLAAALVILVLVGKVLGTLLGKIFVVPLILLLLGLSYKANFEDSRKARLVERDAATLNRWAEQVYGYVRDSMYYVVQAMADRMSIIKPNAAYDIEMSNNYFRQDGYIVFQFYVQLSRVLDKVKFEDTLTKTIIQMHRDGRLVGISPDLVEIDNLLYCPLQVLNVEPYDDGYTIQIVFANEDTIPLVKRAKHRNRKSPGQSLIDDEL